MIEPFNSALPILKTLNDNGYSAFFVGGSVRDFLLNRPIGDIDIATSATPQQVMSVFPKTVPVGIEHGTVMVIFGSEQYEVTTFRSESEYDDFRHPNEVQFITSIEADLSRRDFTINAMAMSIDEVIIDPFYGQKDLNNKVIQAVGNAHERFKEDPLRMMRAIRFVSQLSFALSKETERAITDNAFLLERIAVERTRIELDKLFRGKQVQQSLQLMIECELYKYMPCLKSNKKQLVELSQMPLYLLKKQEELWAAFVYFLKPSDVTSFLREWKSSKTFINDVKSIYECLLKLKESEWTSEIVYNLGGPLSFAASRVKALLGNKDIHAEEEKVKKIHQHLPIQCRKEIQVNGNDLVKWCNQKPGPWLATALEKIEVAIVNGKLENDKEKIKRWLEVCNQI